MSWGSFSASLASHIKLLINKFNSKNFKSVAEEIEQVLTSLHHLSVFLRAPRFS